MGDPAISFDKAFAIRALEADKYEEATKLKTQCKEFTEKMEKFKDITNAFMEIVESKAKIIEAEKLRGIGLRNQVESEKEVRKRKKNELEQLIAEKQSEIERYSRQYDNLLRIEQDHKILIEKLTNNEL